MNDPSGSTSWSYDARGRVIQETKVINGVSSSFVTQWDYNSADQAVWMKYPNGNSGTVGEQVNFNSYPHGAFKNLYSPTYSTYYTQHTIYDEAGRVTERYLGGSNLAINPILRDEYGYLPWEAGNGQMNTLRTTARKFYDGFNTGVPLNSRWEWYTPQAGPTYSLTDQPNWLRISVPNTAAFDHWSHLDKAPQMKTALPANASDWTAETRVSLNQYTAGSGFQAGIMVRFGQYDIAYFGFYQGTTLRLERSGQVNLAQVSNSATTVWLRVSKKGSNYTFAYKTTASGNWIDLTTKTWSTTPTHVGMIVKTWTATAVKADFDHFSLVSEIRQDLEYTYDTVGNITSIYDRLVPETLTYTYDNLYRLTGVSGGMNESYSYSASTGNLSSKTGMGTYGYNDASHKHAVTHLSGVQKYWYDANGNMTKRIANGLTYNLSYDAENRLVGVSGAATATFTGVYPERQRRNGDGNRVKSVENGVTTVYIGSYYEWSSAGNTRYYYGGGQRVAMRREGYSSNNGLYYLVGDHLGSTSLVLNSSGTIVQQTKYKPWGEVRSGEITLTDFGFTGQRTETSLGLSFYISRYYDSSLGRFTSADTIVPGAGNPLAWDRYAGMFNNPLVYIDPDGHNPKCGPDGIFCDTLGQVLPNEELFDVLVNEGYFVPTPEPSTLIDPRYNTPGRVEAVIRNYDQFRKFLFTIYGFGALGKFLAANGMLLDKVFMAMIAFVEFSSESGVVYLKSIEALSNQYYGEAVDNPGPMKCRGRCTIEKQLMWATQMQAWYRSGFADYYTTSDAWLGQLNAAQMAIDKYYHVEDSSWFWGDVTEADLVKYNIVVKRYSDPPVYPGKPYFIVYKL